MKKRLAGGILMTLIFAGFTYLVKTYDVAPVGPQDTTVGFSSINSRFHDMTGVNMDWYNSTELLGYAVLCIAAIFALAGLIQLIMRKSLFKVDREILAMGVLFAVVIAAYVAFEKVVINYRPVVMPGELYPEPSYPSSHTMLVVVVMGAVMLCLGRYIYNAGLNAILRLVGAAVIIIMAGGRLYSGVHWLTDIVGGLILSAALLLFYSAAIYTKKAPGYSAKH